MDDQFRPNEGYRDAPFTDSNSKLIVNLQLRRGLRTSEITIAATATKIPTTPLSKRRAIYIQPNSSNPVYIGGADVTVANGFPIYPRGVMRIEVSDDIDVYGISTSGVETIRLIEGA